MVHEALYRKELFDNEIPRGADLQTNLMFKFVRLPRQTFDESQRPAIEKQSRMRRATIFNRTEAYRLESRTYKMM